MKTSTRHLRIILLLTFSAKFLFGQKSCNDTKLLGNWTMVNSFYFQRPLNFDSLLKSLDKTTDSLSIWTFHDSATYQIRYIKYSKRKSKGHYKFIADKCEVRLGRKKKTPEGLIFHIVFIDDKKLIMKCNKPINEVVYLLRRT